MKQTILYPIYMLLAVLLLMPATVAAQGIRISPQKIGVRNDSLQILFEMDLNDVRVNSLTAVSFTPVLQVQKGGSGRLELPPVVITGSKRFRFERRERALATGQPQAVPYLILIDHRKTRSKNIRYQVAVPYSPWMQNASLLLRQELKDCCDRQLLGVDTLKQHLALQVSGMPATDMAVQPSRPVAPKTSRSVASKQAVGPTSRVAAPAPVPARVPAGTPVATPGPLRPQHQRPADTGAPDYASMLSYLRPDGKAAGKQHIQSAILYFDYPIGKDDIYPDYKNNREEINKIDRIMVPLQDNRFTSVSRIRICGYSSPDGPYGDNERLAKTRSGLFAYYLRNAYDIPRSLVEVSSVAEDWEGLTDLLMQTKPAWLEAALQVIRRYGIFSGREKHLMDLLGGQPYKEMLRHYFPKLRRIEVVVQYNVRKVESEEASELIYTQPDLLSLEEMYGVARYYRPGTDQYREVYEIAAYHFPDDVIANVNAASAVMLTGDLKSAWNYLRKVEADPRAWNNIGVLTLMEGNPAGAAVWFRKAVGIDPVKARRNLEYAESYLNDEDE